MPSIHFRKDFFCRIAEDLDSDRSSLYEVPSSDRAVGVPIIVKSRLPVLPSETRRNSAGYSKALAIAYTSASCRTSSSDDDPGTIN